MVSRLTYSRNLSEQFVSVLDGEHSLSIAEIVDSTGEKHDVVCG